MVYSCLKTSLRKSARILKNFEIISQASFISSRKMSDSLKEKMKMAKRLEGTESSVWVEFGTLATQENALNLGQGFPDYYPPSFVTKALSDVSQNTEHFEYHQYARSYGLPRLVKALSNEFSSILKRKIDPMKEILVTIGAYGSLFCAHQGLLNHGDEVIIIEPFFDCYEPMTRQAGAVPVFVSLKSTKGPGEPTTTEDWTFDREEMRRAFTPKTKFLIFNNPNNPLGKVYTLDEMLFISSLCKEFNVVVISDEVYDRLVYPGVHFIRMANLPDMYERTITIGSAGKTFSVTGWKLGWSIGPPPLIHPLCIVHQNCCYTCPTPIQEAVALSFERELEYRGMEDSYFRQFPYDLVPKRDKVVAMLKKINMEPVVPQGGYFIIADISKTNFKEDPNNPETKDYQFVKWMTRNKKLSAIPNSAFYSQNNKFLSKNYIRFCFNKKDSTLEKAGKIFYDWHASMETK